MKKIQIQKGDRYGKGIVIKFNKKGVTKNGDKFIGIKLLCDCGNEYVARRDLLIAGKKKSCGCLLADTIEKKRIPIKTGERYGRGTVIKKVQVKKSCGIKILLKCDCGNKYYAGRHSLKFGIVLSCGCLGEENRLKVMKEKSKRSGRYHSLYDCWRNMLQRCNDMNNKNYGGRGIKVCKEWQEKASDGSNPGFWKFAKWSEENGYHDGKINNRRIMEIDRRNNNKGYSPKNCRWVSRVVNMNNTRKTRRMPKVMYKNKEWYPTELLKIHGIEGLSVTTFVRRIKKNWSVKRALKTPVKVYNYTS